MAKSAASTFKLPNGKPIPVIGFGVYDSPKDKTKQSCLEAINAGYRHIDTAEIYENEEQVGEAIKGAGVPREELFITTKIYPGGATGQETRQFLLESIRKIDGMKGYVDLLLIHNASVGMMQRERIWKQMEALVEAGNIKSIGVSNFGIAHLKHLKEFATIWPPAVNQLELHPWLQQPEVCQWCEENGIVLEAYCPLVRNQKADDATLKEIADKHGKTTAQVLIRFCLQKNWVPLPKSDDPERIKQNVDVFDFELDGDDMKRLSSVKQEPALVLAVNNEDRDGHGS